MTKRRWYERDRRRPEYAPFAGRVRRAREAAGLSQQAVAERAGLSWKAVQRYENQRALPTMPSLVALARALGTDAGRLAGDE